MLNESRCRLFYGTEMYLDISVPSFAWTTVLREHVLEGCYIHARHPVFTENTFWYRSDFTPVLIQDVPKEYILMELLLR